jgi:hypothetical protein
MTWTPPDITLVLTNDEAVALCSALGITYPPQPADIIGAAAEMSGRLAEIDLMRSVLTRACSVIDAAWWDLADERRRDRGER